MAPMRLRGVARAHICMSEITSINAVPSAIGALRQAPEISSAGNVIGTSSNVYSTAG